MKKILLLAGTCAALAACNLVALDPEQPIEEQKTATAFVAGQQVRLSVSSGSDTKSSSQYNGDNIDFFWSEGDQILVCVGDSPSIFTLVAGAGSKTGTFQGTMPAAGNTFDAQFPITPASISTQYGVGEALPLIPGLSEGDDWPAMIFNANKCEIDKPFTLTPSRSAIRLNLWGKNKKIDKIVVTSYAHGLKNESYTLLFVDDIVIGQTEETATPFTIVLPTGIYSVSVDVYETYTFDDPIYVCSYSTKESLNFGPGNVVNMPAKLVSYYPNCPDDPTKIGDVVWAPANCGYDSTHPYGLMYQWGRWYGHGYSPEEGAPSPISTAAATASDGNDESVKNCFYTVSPCWYSNANVSDKWGYNPCPTGWKLPTMDEFCSMFYSDYDPSTHTGTTIRGSWDSETSSWNFGGVRFPLCGALSDQDATGKQRGQYGHYWVSEDSFTATSSVFMTVKPNNNPDIIGSGGNKSFGLGVRCVKDNSTGGGLEPQY